MDRMIDIGTHRLHMDCLGQGQPTVVIDVGIGESYTSWRPIQEALARDTLVCAYDRAGYGRSEPGPMPRDHHRAASELASLLECAGIAGPCLFLAHSLGALNAQALAHGFPECVAGLVLLDPPPARFIAGEAFGELGQMADQETNAMRQAAEGMRQSSAPYAEGRAVYFDALASEHASMFSLGADALAFARSTSDLPLVVIASEQPNPRFGDLAEGFQRFWIRQCQELAASSSKGEFILARGCGHHIHLDAPDLVLCAVREMLRRLAQAT